MRRQRSIDKKKENRSTTITTRSTTQEHNTNRMMPHHVRVLSVAVFLALIVMAYAISNLLYDTDDTSATLATSHVKVVGNAAHDGHQAYHNIQGDNASDFWQLQLVTMNIAQLVPSKSATALWNATQQVDALLSELLQSRPDVICLQECPTAHWAGQVFAFNYTLVGSTPSHAGHVSLLVRQDWSMAMHRIPLPEDIPIVAATLSWKQQKDHSSTAFVVASMHLEPFEQGATVRRRELQALITAAADTDVLVVAGDSNMRDSEDEKVEESSSLALRDAWKLAGSRQEARYSWDTVAHHDPEWQNLYYGSRTGAYQRRYDRIYIRDISRRSTMQVEVPTFGLIANHPVSESPFHFLSDHFGIAATLNLTWA